MRVGSWFLILFGLFLFITDTELLKWVCCVGWFVCHTGFDDQKNAYFR